MITVSGRGPGGVMSLVAGEARWQGRVSDPPSLKLQAWLAAQGLAWDEVRAALAPAPEAPAPEARWWVRPIREPRGEPRLAADLATAVVQEIHQSAAPDTVVEWEDRAAFACLDVDWHADPGSAAPEAVALRLSPTPCAWWRSHGGGLHALYPGLGGWPADELAAAAARRVLDCTGSATAEVLARTRHPGSARGRDRCGPVTVLAPDTRIVGAEGAVDEAARDEYLAAVGLVLGQRSDHTRCPIDPGPSHGADPVVWREDGVYCHRCAARGDGWRSWGRLLGTDPAEDPIRDAARGLAVWSHVRLLAAALEPRMPEDLARLAYRALVRAVHAPDDPRIPALDRPWRLARGTGVWLDSETLEPVQPAVGMPVTQGMPSAQWARRAGEVWETGLDPIAHDRHRTDQAVPGYRPVQPVRGLAMWAVHREYPAGGPVRVPAPSTVPYPPRYLPIPARVRLAECEAELVRQLPALPLAYLRVLIAARAYAESGTGPVPIIACTGVTGAAKTATVLLAAAIVGDRVADVRADDAHRWAEALAAGTQRAGFVLLDEYAKGMPPWGRIEAWTRLLDVRREYTYRRLRVGPVTVPISSALVITDTDLGAEILSYAQVARRVCYLRLLTRVPDWSRTVDVTRLRDRQDTAYLADSWLSWQVDELAGDDPGWYAVAERLGAPRLETLASSGVEGIDTARLVCELYRLAQDAEPAGEPWVGGGWRLLDTQVPSPLLSAWEALCDGSSDTARRRIRLAREIDLAAALGLPGPIDLDVAPHGALIGFRFRRAADGAVNGEIQ